MKIVLTIFTCISLAFQGIAQNQVVTPRQITRLPLEILESSGIAISGSNLIWSHEDSGNDNLLYGFDTTGQLKRTLTITNVPNTDWEDLAVDEDGNIFIADLGNNSNQRTDLAIYKIPDPGNITGNNVTAEILNVSFADQTSFPPAAADMNFDVEAIAWRDGYLYLFTKNRSNPFSGITKMYKMEDQPGSYSLMPEDSFVVGTDSYIDKITSADYNRINNELVLLTHNRLISFKNFQDDRFFDGTMTEYTFSSLPGQNEAIAYVTPGKLYMTEEGSGGQGGWLYELRLPGSLGVITAGGNHTLSISPVPAAEYISVTTDMSDETPVLITNSYGQTILKSTLGSCRSFDVSEFKMGIYFFTLSGESFRITRRFVKQ